MPRPMAWSCSTATPSVQSINRGAEKLFGYQSREVTGLPFANLFAQESQRDVRISLDRATRSGLRTRATAATSSAAAARAASFRCS